MKPSPCLGKILIVGSAPGALGTIPDALASNGFCVTFSAGGEDGLRQARRTQPDLILLEAAHPAIDGFELCRRLKSLDRTRDIPVVFMLSSHAVRMRNAAFEAGGVDYVVKPLRIDEVLSRAGTHARLRAVQKQLEEQGMRARACTDKLKQRVAKRTASFLESEQRFREIFDSVSDFLYVLEVCEGTRFRFVEVNLGVERLMRVPRDDIIGKYVEDVIPGARKQGVLDRLQRCLDAGTVIDEDIVLDLPGGRHDFHATYFPIHEKASGRIYRIVSLARDVTIRKQHEAMRRERDALESLFRKFIEVGPGVLGVYRRTADGRTSMPYSSPKLEEVTGFNRDEMRKDASSALRMVHPDDVDAHVASISESARTLSPWHNEFRVRHPEKGEIWLEGHSIPERAPDGATVWYGFLLDITMRKQHEAMRQERDELESLVSKIVEVAPGALLMYRLDKNGKRSMPYASSKLEEITGFDPEEMRHDASCDLRRIRPDDVGRHVASIAESARKLTPWHHEFRVRHPRKGEVWIEGRAIPERAPDGATVWYGFLHDVTIRKRAEELLHASTQKFRTLAENLPDLVIRYDRGCRRVYVNRAFQKHFDNDAPVIDVRPGVHWYGSMPVEEYTGILKHVMNTGEAAERSMSWYGRDGKVKHYFFHVVAERDRKGVVAGALTIARDITALKEAELRLAESREQLRELAAYRDAAREEERKHIARELHDELGQFLSALRMQTSMLRIQFGKDNPELTAHVNGMIQMVDSNIQMVRDIASSLRPVVLDLGIVAALEWLVDDFLNYSGIACKLAVMNEDVDMDNHCATTLFRVVQESLTNVARHADASHVEVILQCSDSHYRLRVCDNGKGFHPDAPPRKSLGLIGMRERVLMLGGEIRISSMPGQGTAVDVLIPVEERRGKH